MRYLLLVLFASLVFQITAQTILKENGKFGLVDTSGKVILKPVYDKVELGQDLAAFYILKQGRKYGFTYRVELDSAIRLDPKQVHWKTVAPEFDSLVVYVIGTGRTENKYGYTTFIYKQAEKWGMLFIETASGGGGGIFPSAGFSVYGMGRLYREKARYDKIYNEQDDGFYNRDDFYPTVLNGKFGLWNPMTQEEHVPQFDTIPLVVSDMGRFRKVRKNGKWGLIQLDKATKSIQYIVPCRCNEFSSVRDYLYVCIGIGDTITFFDTENKKEYTPTHNGKPLCFNSPTQKVWPIGIGEKGSRLAVLAITDDSKPKIPERQSGYNEYHFINPIENKVISFNDTGVFYSTERTYFNNLISKAPLSVSNRERQYDFYNIQTGDHRFSIILDTLYNFEIAKHRIENKQENKPGIDRLYYHDEKGKEITIGYYNITTQKFRYKRHKYNPNK